MSNITDVWRWVVFWRLRPEPWEHPDRPAYRDACQVDLDAAVAGVALLDAFAVAASAVASGASVAGVASVGPEAFAGAALPEPVAAASAVPEAFAGAALPGPVAAASVGPASVVPVRRPADFADSLDCHLP